MVETPWGFEPVSELVWLKRTKRGKRHFGMGRTVRMEHEICIIARAGEDPRRSSEAHRSTFEAQTPTGARGHAKHSAKPDEFYALVEQLAAGPYVELFARAGVGTGGRSSAASSRRRSPDDAPSSARWASKGRAPEDLHGSKAHYLEDGVPACASLKLHDRTPALRAVPLDVGAAAHGRSPLPALPACTPRRALRVRTVRGRHGKDGVSMSARTEASGGQA